jgi:hypothetical protein
VLAALACALLLAYAFAAPGRWLILLFATLILLPPITVGDANFHPSIVVAGLGILVGMARTRWMAPRRASPFTALNWAVAALFSALVVSLGFALLYSGFSVAAGSAARVLLLGIAVFVYFSASQGPDRQSPEQALRTNRLLFAAGLAGAAFACLDFVFQFPAPANFGAQFLWLESGVYRRAQGLFYDSGALGNFCAFFVIMSVVALAQPRARRVIHPVIAGTGIVVFGTALMLSFSRAAVAAVAIGCLAFAALEWRRWAGARTIAVLAALILVAVAVFSYALPETAAGYWQRLGPGIDVFLQSPDRILSGRLDSWRTVAGFAAEHPWQVLLGIGYKTLPVSTYLGRPVIADNMYLSAFVETGLAGFAALVAFNIAVLAACWRSARRGSFYGKWMLCFWAGETVQMLSADILTYWRLLPLYFWVLAQAVRRTDLREATADRPIQ